MELTYLGQKAYIDLKNGAALTDLTLASSSGMKHLISAGDNYLFSSSFLFPFPNRLANGTYSWKDKTYQFPLNDFGRPNALHGFIHDREFRIITQSQSTLTAEYSYDGSLDYYPFPFIFAVSYTLSESAISISVEIVNQADGPIPFGLGWHPYFHADPSLAALKMKLPFVLRNELDELSIPTGNSTTFDAFNDFQSLGSVSLDDSFLITQNSGLSSFLRFPDNSVLEIWQDDQFPYLQIFTPDDRNAVAIEPMTCGVNSWNTDDPVPSLDSKFTGSFGLKLS